MMNSLNNVVEEYVMKVNINKTKTMKIGKNTGEKFSITINGQRSEQVTRFSYLGSILTDGKCTKDIITRIECAKEIFNKRKELFNKRFNENLKKSMIKTLIWSVLLYGCETWALRKEDIRRLESCEMWFWRRMEGISWEHRSTNEHVLHMIGEERSFIKTIPRRRDWLGHTLRHNGLLQEVIEGGMEGKKPRGRRRTNMLDALKKNRTYAELKRAAQDRDKWRKES